MAIIAQASIDQVKAAADMVEIVGARTQLRKVGARWTGRCPFHEERTPSFSVNAADKLFYCFGCGMKGDLITFVKETEGLDFVGAIEWLAERHRIPLAYEETSPQAEEKRERRGRLLSLLEQAAVFYQRTLWESAAGASAREYLAERCLPRRRAPRASRRTSSWPPASSTGAATTTTRAGSSSRSPTRGAGCSASGRAECAKTTRSRRST